MKISLALGPRRKLSRQTAWGCFTSNLAYSGVGSLAAGRRSGYAQFVIVTIGMVMTLICLPRFFLWYKANWSQLMSGDVDPGEIWTEIRPALWAFTVYGTGLLWGIITGLDIVREAKLAEKVEAEAQRREPPKLF